jgi:hypothetical protein
MTDTAEAKSEETPQTSAKTEDPAKTEDVDEVEDTDEVHPLDRAREEGLRRNPTWQTGQINTTEHGGHVDIRKFASAFEEGRQAGVRRAAEALEKGEPDPRVILPEDADEAERAKEALRTEAASLPKDPGKGDVPPGDVDGGNVDLQNEPGDSHTPDHVALAQQEPDHGE